MTRLYVLDCGSLAAQHYFGKPGEVDAMITGVDTFLWEWREKLRPTHAVACHDSRESVRRKKDPSYKANRETKPDDYVPQLIRLPDVFAAHGITNLSAAGWEADDVIASVVARHANEGVECVIVGEDKDTMQLIDGLGCVKQYTPRAGAFVGSVDVQNKFGVPPWRLGDWLALVGDKSDNIVGIKGVGDAIATHAMSQTRSMRELFRRARERSLVPPAGKKSWENPQKLLAEGEAAWRAARDLIELNSALPVPDTIEAFAMTPSERAA